MADKSLTTTFGQTSGPGAAETPNVGERLLGYLPGLNLNSVAQTTVFTFPAGITGGVVTRVHIKNYSGAATTASISFGRTGTPTDWKATATNANAATTKMVEYTNTASLAPVFSASDVFVANVTIAQGSAATADVLVFGYCF